MLDELATIYAINSVSSAEKQLQQYLSEKYSELGYQINKDGLYSVFAETNKADKELEKVLVACPMDEIGLMVERVFPNGRLSFVCLEAQSPAVLLGQRVQILARDGSLYPAVISTDCKLLEQVPASVKESDLFIELCDPSDSKKILPGDLVSFASELVETDHTFVGRSLNQKVLLAVELELLRELQATALDYQLSIGAVAQSTVGFRGTQTATYVTRPNLAIALTAFEAHGSKSGLDLGSGVVVSCYDRQMLPDHQLLDYVTSKYAVQPYLGLLANDGSFIHKTLSGTPTLALGIVMRNLGTANVVADKHDIKALVNFLKHFLLELELHKVGRPFNV